MPIDPRFLAYLAIAVVASAALIDIITRAFRWYLDRDPEPRRRIHLSPDSRQEIPVYEELQEVPLDELVVQATETPLPAPTLCARCGRPIDTVQHFTATSGPLHGKCLLDHIDNSRGAA